MKFIFEMTLERYQTFILYLIQEPRRSFQFWIMEFHLMKYDVPESLITLELVMKTINKSSELEQKEHSDLTSRIEIVCT